MAETDGPRTKRMLTREYAVRVRLTSHGRLALLPQDYVLNFKKYDILWPEVS
jgi:hypothetical protein